MEAEFGVYYSGIYSDGLFYYMTTWGLDEGVYVHPLNDYYPSNVSFNFNGSEIWNYSGVFQTSNLSRDFASELNNYLDDCIIEGGLCHMDFNLSSDEIGYLNFTFFTNYSVPPLGGAVEPPELEEVWEVIKGGGSLGEVAEAWNPSVYPEIGNVWSNLWDGGNIEGFLDNTFQFSVLLIKFVFRQPASLVPVGGA